MGPILQDFRYAIRMLARTPGFTAVALVTLALGIGANTAIFSLANAVLFRPLPFREPARLVSVWDTYQPLLPRLGVSPLELEALGRETGIFEQMAWYRATPRDLNLLTPGAAAVELHATLMSAKLLPLLGVQPELGRGFSESESPQSVLLSHAVWQDRFAASPTVLGRPIRLNDQDFTIVGVMPSSFQFPEATHLWLPAGPLLADELTNPVRHSLGLVARLRSGVTEQQAAARVQSVFRRLAEEHPKTSKGFGIEMAGLQRDLTSATRPALLVLLGAVALVLLIACGNIANLLLSRAGSRTREIAVRTALGAGLGRLVRQLLTESLVLALLGGALGLGLAIWSLATFSPIPATVDSTVLLFLLFTSVAAGVAFGIAPALQAVRVDPVAAIKSGTAGSGSRTLGRSTVVVLQFAFTLIVLVGAGILATSFRQLMRVNPGFAPQGVLTVRLSWPPSQKPAPLFIRLRDRLRALPGVESVAAASTLPLVANRAAAIRFHVPGSSLINPDALPAAQLRAVSPDYFRTMGVPLRSGRSFTEQDLQQPVVVINESMARRYWPGQDPIGTKFVTGPWGPNPNWSTIIGVAADVKQFGLDSEPTMDVYFPGLAPTYLVLRTTAAPLSIAGAVQREIQKVDGLALSELRTMEQVLSESAKSRRWTMGLLSVFAILALALALVGIYGVTSWAVSQRTREFGVRIALGASRAQVVALVLRYGATLCSIGLAIGLAGVFVLQRFLASLAFGVSTADPVIYVASAALLTAAALLACYLPARRAGRLDPLVALRWE